MARPGKKFCVLFMRDDSDVRRYRINSLWLAVTIIVAICLICVAAFGIWLGVTSWKHSKRVEVDNQLLTRQLAEATVRLERLENVEMIGLLEASNSTGLLGSVSNHSNAEVNKSAEPTAEVDQPILAEAGQGGPSSDPTDTNEATEATTIVPEPVGPVPSSDNSTGNATSTPVDMGFAQVQNLSLQPAGSNRLNLSFNLANSGKLRSLTGQVSLELVTKDRRVLAAKVANPGDLDFQIQRYKRVSARIVLSDDLKFEDLYGVKINVETPRGEVVFSNVYPLPGRS